jgi:hypothetical protein
MLARLQESQLQVDSAVVIIVHDLYEYATNLTRLTTLCLASKPLQSFMYQNPLEVKLLTTVSCYKINSKTLLQFPSTGKSTSHIKNSKNSLIENKVS